MENWERDMIAGVNRNHEIKAQERRDREITEMARRLKAISAKRKKGVKK